MSTPVWHFQVQFSVAGASAFSPVLLGPSVHALAAMLAQSLLAQSLQTAEAEEHLAQSDVRQVLAASDSPGGKALARVVRSTAINSRTKYPAMKGW
jgi:hypothetical protein